MKHLCLFLFFTLTFIMFSYSQSDSAVAKPWKTPFKRGYIRLGINKLGSNLNPAISPYENAKAGNLGAGNGYTLEFGHIFYFLSRKERRLFNAGLDWTILNLPIEEVLAIPGNISKQFDIDGTTVSETIANYTVQNIGYHEILSKYA
ncbi:MAG TPA: hypothetical protein PKV73_17630, partial [Agriterribacter sp.]|nr:hypothetical protein [Agriterribacter sp.]